MKKFILLFTMLFLVSVALSAHEPELRKKDYFYPGAVWLDTDGRLINAHGGGVLYHDGKYYWYGEHKAEHSFSAHVGVTCYSSDDLYNWKNEGVALAVSDDPDSPITDGCTIERPKVIYNPRTGKFVMYFHLELKGKGYDAANVGVAVSDSPTGPFTFLKNSRVNPGKWPANMAKSGKKPGTDPDSLKWWTPEWKEAIADGLFTRRDLEGGQMSRDMTLFVDNDGKAYHIYSSEDNLTLQIAELTDDYLDHTGKYIRIDPAGHNEAPTVFRRGDKYYMVTSGCTGWDPNAARLFTADSIWGPWERHDNPCRGKDADLTFLSQGTFILPVPGKEDAFIFMADKWVPSNPIDGRYVWLPISFNDEGMPEIHWHRRWQLNEF